MCRSSSQTARVDCTPISSYRVVVVLLSTGRPVSISSLIFLVISFVLRYWVKEIKKTTAKDCLLGRWAVQSRVPKLLSKNYVLVLCSFLDWAKRFLNHTCRLANLNKISVSNKSDNHPAGVSPLLLNSFMHLRLRVRIFILAIVYWTTFFVIFHLRKISFDWWLFQSKDIVICRDYT